MSGSPTIKLNDGHIMPALGFGTFSEPLVAGTTAPAVIAALEAGWRHLDSAWMYENEHEVGQGLAEFLQKHPSVKRSDIFITTKVWPHLLEPQDIEWSLNNSISKLGVDYVDLFLIHWPFAVERTDDHQIKRGSDGKYIVNKALTEDLEPSWRAMEKLCKSGKARSIGVSNWTIAGLDKLLAYADIKPVANQIEIHPYFPNTDLVTYLFAHDITPVAYSPLGSQEGTGERLLADRELNALAQQKGCSIAQLLIAWGIKRGYAVLPKSHKEERIKSNFELVNLTDDEFAEVSKAESKRGYRYVSCKSLTEFNYDVWPEEER